MSLNEWNIDPDIATMEYHFGQYNEPYRSTVHFEKFCKEKLGGAKLVIDAGCGAGAPTNYLAEQNPDCQFLGLEISRELLTNTETRENLTFERDDLTNLKVRFGVDGVTLIQVLSWLPWYDNALHQIATRLRPKWIAASTLMYEGDIDAQIVINEHKRPRRAFYNVYGLPGMTRFMAGEGYKLNKVECFDIDWTLPIPSDDDLMKTYTVHGLQFSGPLWLPWAFVMFERG